jgi:CheY-like chemotaxis protein/HPt (histidine-containing phosphotransfer) domain-containing protein
MPYGRILLVDDVSSNLYVAKGLLMPYGLNIDTAVSGFEAVEKIKNGGVYDIIFMDHMMPKMNGIEATKIIRDMEYSHPIVALTANALAGQADFFIANGFDGYLSKPIDTREMNALLNHFIRNKQPPEVIETARRETKQLKNNTPAAIQKAQIHDNELILIFLEDIDSTLTLLKEILPNLNTPGNDTIDTFITAVHGMKSALTNIGETQLSDAALKLEMMGKNGEMAMLPAETADFINSLQSLRDKLQKRQ